MWTLITALFVCHSTMLWPFVHYACSHESVGDPLSNDEVQFALEVIDAQAFIPNTNPGITEDPASVVDVTWNRTGVWADGASVLVIRLTPLQGPQNPPLDVTFKVRHTNPNNAYGQTTSFVGSISRIFPATLPAPDTGMGNVTAKISAASPKIVYYTPPNNFWFSHLQLKQELIVTANDSNGVEIAKARLNLIRPTIMLNHGFTSNPQNMDAVRNMLTAQNRQCRVINLDWSTMNTSGYDEVVTTSLFRAIRNEIQNQRKQLVAATRLDIFGHSMGGVIVKWYASNIPNLNIARRNGFPNLAWTLTAAQYIRSNNYGVGDIRRFVSVGSPYEGSPIADEFSNALGYNVTLVVLNAFTNGSSL